MPRAIIAFLLAASCRAAVVPRLSLEELVDQAERIIQGRVERSWTAWDSAHRYIWTHYQIRLTDSIKGDAPSLMTVSELGGTLDGVELQIPGVVSFDGGEEVLAFLSRTPGGYWRTCGYGQGKYSIDRDGRVHANLADLTLVELEHKTVRPFGTPIESLNGQRLLELKDRIRRLARQRGEGR